MKCLIKNCLNYCQIAYYANILLEIDNLNALVVVEFEGWGSISKHVYCGNNIKNSKTIFSIVKFIFRIHLPTD